MKERSSNDRDNRWTGKLNLGWKDGRRVRKCFYGSTRGEVQEKLTKALRERDLGMGPTAGASPILTNFLRDWLASVKANVRVRSYEKYASTVDKHLIPYVGTVRLEKLTPPHVQKLLDGRLAAGLHPTTVRAIRLILRQALRQAVDWSMVPRNVVDLVKGPRTTRHEWTPLDPEGARRLLAACQGERLEAIYLACLEPLDCAAANCSACAGMIST